MPAKRYNLSMGSGTPPGETCPKHFPWVAFRRHPDQNHDVDEQGFYSESLPTKPISKVILWNLYSQSLFFSHYPQLMTIVEGWNEDSLVNQPLLLIIQLSLHHNRQVQYPHHCRRCPRRGKPGANSYFSSITLNCKPPQCLLVVSAQWS